MREFYMRVIFLLIFTEDRAAEGPMDVVYWFIYCCRCARLSRRGCVHAHVCDVSPSFSRFIYDLQKELFKGDKIDQNRLQPDQILIHSIWTMAKIKMSFACSQGAAGSQGHMARFKIYTLSVCCSRSVCVCVRRGVDVCVRERGREGGCEANHTAKEEEAPRVISPPFTPHPHTHTHTCAVGINPVMYHFNG